MGLEATNNWANAGRLFGSLVALIAALGMAYIAWRSVRKMLQPRVHAAMADGLAVFAALVLGTAGLGAALGEMRAVYKSGVMGDVSYVVIGILEGLVGALGAGFLPRQYGPIEFLTIVGFGAYGIHWLATRFAPRYTPPAATTAAPAPPAA